jgi:hypothetical protein
VEEFVEKRRETDGRYPRIQYTPIYRFSGHQPYVPIPPSSFLLHRDVELMIVYMYHQIQFDLLRVCPISHPPHPLTILEKELG